MLWRYERGTIDWDRVMAAVRESDIVVTAPGYTGMDTREESRGEPAQLGAGCIDWKGRPGSRVRSVSRMGRFEPVEVDVFVRARWTLAMSASLSGRRQETAPTSWPAHRPAGKRSYDAACSPRFRGESVAWRRGIGGSTMLEGIS